MNLASRPWIVAAILGLLALSPAHAGMTSEELKLYEGYKAQAEKGNSVAQYNMGHCYATGEGVAKDAVQAVSWYRKAAEQGLTEAQYNLGLCYATGEGVAKDVIEAYAYWSLAGITAEAARESLAILEKQMSSDARLLGQQRAKQLQKEIERSKTILKAMKRGAGLEK